MAIATFKRYEKKYLITKEQLDQIWPRLLEYMDLDPFCLNGGEYRIYSIYYDTDNHDVIRHNSSSPVYKEKMRIRSYYDNKDPEDKIFMEIKKKSQGQGNKRRIKLKLKDFYNYLKTNNYDRNSQIMNEINYYFKYYNLKPAIYIAYDRMSYCGKEDKNLRITFDSNLRSRNSDLKLELGDAGKCYFKDKKYIMEIKTLGSMPLWLVRSLSELKIYPTSFSKYGSIYQKELKERNDYIYA